VHQRRGWQRVVVESLENDVRPSFAPEAYLFRHFVCGKCGGSKLESLSVVQEREYTASVLRQRDKLQSAVSGEIGEAGEAGEIGKQKVKGEGRSQRARRRKRDKKKPAQTNDSPAPESIQPAAAEPVKLSVQPAAWTSTAEGTRQKKEIFCQKCNAAQPAVYNYRLQIAVTPLGTPRMHITLPTPKIDLPASLSVYHQSYEPPNAPKTTFGSPEEALRAAAQPELYLDNQHQQVWPLMAYNQVVERDMTAFPASKYEELCVRANTLGIDLHAAFSRAVQQAGPWMIQLSPVNDWLVNTSLQVRV